MSSDCLLGRPFKCYVTPGGVGGGCVCDPALRSGGEGGRGRGAGGGGGGLCCVVLCCVGISVT